jgi:D-apiose dehydrogenase
MKTLRFGILGTGFWSRYQLAGWKELEGAECVALYNRTPAKAHHLAKEFHVPSVYEDAEELLRRERPDFIDIITGVDTHERYVQLAAAHGIPVICQKPMGPSREVARGMVVACREAGVPFFIHENWRWQRPIRQVKRVLDSGQLGRIIRGRIDYAHSFPVFDNQPFLKELDRFILADMGSHILDVARFLWGEASELYCQTRRLHRDIRGEDVATVMMRMSGGTTVTCNLSYASRWEFDRFPETFVAVEGTEGGVTLGPDYTLKVTTRQGTTEERVPPVDYSWADPAYALVHASIVDCNRNLLEAIQGLGAAETSGEDNLKTIELVYAVYDSAERRESIRIS